MVPFPGRSAALALVSMLALGACFRGPAFEPPAPAQVPEAPRMPAPVVREIEPEPAPPPPIVGNAELLRSRRLVVPVPGVDPSKIRDGFNEARGGGTRTHRALDIMAPRGTPVLAADDGYVYRLSTSTLGGITIYAVDPDERLVYYYAHLDAYREGLAPGQRLAKGDVIGYVGTTGNAPANAPHLHFQVMLMRPDRYWDGVALNPLPFLERVSVRAADVAGK